MIVTISGNLGSGKSTVAKILAEMLKYKHYSTGDYMRKMASDRGISLLDLSKIAENDKAIDEEMDNWQLNLGRNEDNFVIDARIAFHFIPNSIKVYLKVSDDEAVRRTFYDTDPKRQKEANNESKEKTFENMSRRRQSEDQRYQRLYGVSQDMESNYDLIIDTTNIPASEVAQKIIDYVQKSSKSLS